MSDHVCDVIKIYALYQYTVLVVAESWWQAIRAPSTRNFDIIITRGNDFDVVDNNMKDKRVPFYAHM